MSSMLIPISSHVVLLSSLISLFLSLIFHYSPCWSSIIPLFSSGFSLIPCYPPCFFHCPPIDFLLDLMLILMMIVIKSVLPVFSYYPMLSSYPPQVSSLISLFFSCYLPWSLCSSHVSSLLILIMIVIKSIWWCPPLLSSARWWCFLSVLSLWSDYHGWLLIIFISNILLWWSLFLSF